MSMISTYPRKIPSISFYTFDDITYLHTTGLISSSFKKEYTASTENVLEEFFSIKQMRQQGPSPHRLLMTMLTIVTDNRAYPFLFCDTYPSERQQYITA
jgi:hypothetical protein